MSNESTSHIGKITRVNGPIVEACQMEHAGMQEVVEVGGLRLLGEVIKVKNGAATIQVYENTSGLKPGEPVYCTGRPLSVLLGPGLLGTIYDGIQRPLERIAQISDLAQQLTELLLGTGLTFLLSIFYLIQISRYASALTFPVTVRMARGLSSSSSGLSGSLRS